MNLYWPKPEALKSLYRSPGYKKNQLVLCKNYVLQIALPRLQSEIVVALFPFGFYKSLLSWKSTSIRLIYSSKSITQILLCKRQRGCSVFTSASKIRIKTDGKAAINIPSYIRRPSISTRQYYPYKFSQISTSTDAYKFSFLPRTITDWNSLHPEAYQATTPESFKEVHNSTFISIRLICCANSIKQ
jgi:hypothetical protein